MQLFRRWWFWTIVTCAVLGALLVWFFSVDIERPDDSDMVLDRRQVSAAENGYEDLVRLCARIKAREASGEGADALIRAEEYWELFLAELYRASLPEGEAELAESAEAARIAEAEEHAEAMEEDIVTAWDQEAVDALLASWRPITSELEELLAKSDLVLPSERNWDSDLDYVRQGHQLTRLHLLAFADEMRQGRPERALEPAWRLLRLGHRLACAQGVLIEHFVGRSIASWGVLSIAVCVGHADLSREALLEIAERLPAFEIDPACAQDVMRAEYESSSWWIDQFVENAEILEEMGFGPFDRLLFRRELTRRRFLTHYRYWIEVSGRPVRGAVQDPLPERGLMSWLNYTGEQSFCMASSFSTADARFELDVSLRTLGSLIALRLWHIDHGVLPASLAKLVPQYLPELPIDPFDGKPLRYSMTEGRIWSVGTDLLDEGGREPEEDDWVWNNDPDEPTWFIPRW